MKGGVVAITPGGRELALAVGAKTGFAVHLPASLLAEGDNALAFDSLRSRLQELFAAGRPLVLVMAAGIAVRMLAPLLTGKEHDPAVVVMDEAGRFAIPLLGGHWGGANELANLLADKTGAVAVITTATDVRGLTAIDVLARQYDATPEPFAAIKVFSAAVLRGEPVALFSDHPRLLSQEFPGLQVLPLAAFADYSGRFFSRAIHTHQAVFEGAAKSDLYLRPRTVFLGLGCRRGTSAERILAAIDDVLGRFNLAPASVAALASIDAKREEKGLLAAADALGLPLLFFSPAEINALEAPYAVSDYVLETMGVAGVCEPTAMLAAKSRKLLVNKQKFPGVTVAAALADWPS
jgi:cobalt-precorrin 5A hydrolase